MSESCGNRAIAGLKPMKILFLHGWTSTPGGVKPTYLRNQGHEVLNPALPDEDFEAAVRIAQAELDQHHPDVVVGSSRGGAVAMNIDAGTTPLVLLCPAWKRWGTATTVKPGSVILHAPADDVVPFADTLELLRNSGLDETSLIIVGTDHRLADPEPLAAMARAVDQAHRLKLDLDRIVPGVFVGSCPSTTEDIDALKKIGISAVLNLQTDDDFHLENIHWQPLADRYRQVDIEVVRIEVRGPETLRVKLDDCLSAIRDLLKRGQRVLVHCTEGKNRSATVGIAYLHKVLGWDLAQAVKHVEACRPNSDPYLEIIT